MRKGKCPICQKEKARRDCLRQQGEKICSRCCAELRGEACGECPHYAEAQRYEARRYREGTPPEGHYIIEVSPDAEEATHNALTFAERGQVDEAMEAMEKVIRDYPRNHHACYGMGVVLGVKKLTEESIVWFEKCLAIFPYFPEAYYNLGVANRELFRLAKAVTAYRKAVDYGDPEEVYYGHAKSFIESMTQMARENHDVDLETYLKSNVAFDEAFACMEAGDWENALSGFLACTRWVENNVSTHGNLALCYANLGRKAEALAAFDRALEIDPSYEPALQNRRVIERMEEGGVPENMFFEAVNYSAEKMKAKKRGKKWKWKR